MVVTILIVLVLSLLSQPSISLHLNATSNAFKAIWARSSPPGPEKGVENHQEAPCDSLKKMVKIDHLCHKNWFQ